MSLPRIFAENAFHVSGLPTTAQISEAKKRITHLINLSKIDEAEEFESDLDGVVTLRKEPLLRRSLERITSVKDRLREAFFWFDLDTEEDAGLLASLKRGNYIAAGEGWRAAWEKSRRWPARKNLAIALCLRAVHEKNAELFSESIAGWHEIWRSDAFWKFYAEHYCLHDDLGTSRELFPEFREELPQHLSHIVADASRLMASSAVIGAFYIRFGYLGPEIEDAVVTPISRRLNTALDKAAELAAGDKFVLGKQDYGACITQTMDALNDLRLLGIDSYTPIQVLKEKTAEKLRSISVDLHNKQSDAAGAQRLLDIAVKLTDSQTFRAQAEKDKAQLAENAFFGDFMKRLVPLKDDPEGKYDLLQEILVEHPEYANGKDFLPVRRDIIFGYAMDIFLRGKKRFDQKDELGSVKDFAQAHQVLVDHIAEFDLNKEKVLEMVGDVSKEMLAISTPEGISLADRRIKEVSELSEKLKMDDASKYAFVILMQSAIYRDMAPYVQIVRHGQYLVNVGNFTWWLYGVGVLFWIGGFIYKRRRPQPVSVRPARGLPLSKKKNVLRSAKK